MSDELKARVKEKGFNLDWSLACDNANWGKWFLKMSHPNKTIIMGYGDDETSALQNALDELTRLEEELSKPKDEEKK